VPIITSTMLRVDPVTFIVTVHKPGAPQPAPRRTAILRAVVERSLKRSGRRTRRPARV